MTLRAVLLAVSALTTLGSLAAILAGWHALPVAIWGGVIFVSLLIERWHYRPPADSTTSTTSATSSDINTGERFIDPATGALMDVVYDSKTGERRYIEVSDNRRNLSPE